MLATKEREEEKDALMVIEHDLRVAYNRKKEALLNLVKRYFNQSVASDYIAEEDIVALVNECTRLKHEYRNAYQLRLESKLHFL